MKIKTSRLSSALFLTLAFIPQARADVISEWNLTAANYLSQNAGSHYSRGLTMVHVAQFDAVNARWAATHPTR